MIHKRTMKVTYRPPTDSDFAFLAAIYNYAIANTAATFDTEPKPPDYFRSFVPGDELNRMLVAEVDNTVVAYAGTYPFKQRQAYAQTAEVMLYVHRDWQRCGIRAALLGEIHKKNFLEGLHTLIAIMNEDNVQAHVMVKRQGYAFRGEMVGVGFKFGERQSVVIYQYVIGKSEAGSS